MLHLMKKTVILNCNLSDTSWNWLLLNLFHYFERELSKIRMQVGVVLMLCCVVLCCHGYECATTNALHDMIHKLSLQIVTKRAASRNGYQSICRFLLRHICYNLTLRGTSKKMCIRKPVRSCHSVDWGETHMTWFL